MARSPFLVASIIEEHHALFLIHYAPLIAGVSGISLAFLFYILRPEIPTILKMTFARTYKFLLNKWYFDELYHALFTKGALRGGNWLWRAIDTNVIDRLGPNGAAFLSRAIAVRSARLQTGYLYTYAFAMIIGLLVLISWLAYTVLHYYAYPHIPCCFTATCCGAHVFYGSLREERCYHCTLVALAATVGIFLLSLLLLVGSDGASSDYQFVERGALASLATISITMWGSMVFAVAALLTTFLMPICVLCSWKSIDTRVGEFMALFLVLEALVIGTFIALDLLLFYLFEAVLIPMYLIIGIWVARTGSMQPYVLLHAGGFGAVFKLAVL